MKGFTQTVVKLHGFGTAPGMRSRLSFWSLPAVICATRVVHSRKGVVWVSVSTVLGASHEYENVIAASLNAKFTVDRFIGSLNVTTMSAVCATPVAPSAGLVAVIVGGATGHT